MTIYVSLNEIPYEPVLERLKDVSALFFIASLSLSKDIDLINESV